MKPRPGSKRCEADWSETGTRAVGAVGASRPIRRSGSIRNRARALCAVLCLSAAPAMGACPTAADVDGDGVYVDFSDGTYIHFKRMQPEVVGEATYTPEGLEDFFKARYLGFHQVIDATLKDGAPDPDGMLTFQPEKSAPEWPQIAPGAKWAGTIVTQRPDGDFVNSFEMRIEAVGEEVLHISGCNYEADIVKVEETYESGDGASEWRYLRALDIAFIVADGDLGQPYEFSYAPRLIGLEPPR